MKRIKSPMRPAILFLAFACALTSFAKEYTFRIIHNSWLETPYQVVFDSSSHNLKFQESSFSKWKDIFTVTNVKATFVEDTFFEDNFKYWSGANHKTGGILFTKDGNNIFLVFYEMIYYDYSEDEIRSEDFVFWENGKWQRRHNPVDKPLSDLQGDELEFYKTFNALKKDLTSGAINSSVKTTATSTKTSSTSTSSKTPAQTTTAKIEASIPFIQALPPEKGHSKMYVNYTLKSNSDNLRRRLFVWDVNEQKFLLNPTTGQQLMTEKTGTVGGEKQQLVLDLSNLPAASPSRPFVFTICVYVNDPSLQKELAKKIVGVYKWDGSQITFNSGN